MKLNQKELCKKLEACGAKITPYKRSPFSGLNFAMAVSQSGKDIRLFGNDKVEYEIHGISKKNKQVAFTATEVKRTFTRNILVPVGWYTKEELNKGKITPDNIILQLTKTARLDAKNSIAVPGARITKIVVISPTTKKYLTDNYSVRFSVHFSAPKSDTHFLIGQDESSHFICALPEEPRGVSHAHEMLKPTDLRDNWQRQGEFFFVPVNKKELSLINENVSDWKSTSTNNWMRRVSVGISLEYLSSHRAQMLCKIDKDRYVIGKIYDSRPNRHTTLNLTTWHKVIRNRERILSSPQAKYFD